MDLFAPWHLLLILLIVLVIFGPRKLGDVGAAIGKAVRDFKGAVGNEQQVAQAPTNPSEVPPAATAKESDPSQHPSAAVQPFGADNSEALPTVIPSQPESISRSASPSRTVWFGTVFGFVA